VLGLLAERVAVRHVAELPEAGLGERLVRVELAQGGRRRHLAARWVGIAAISALLANLVNNLPAILIIAPIAVASGPAVVLAALVGVNVGPNLTYVGSLATLLWRRILHAEDTDVNLGEFLRLGAVTVPAAIAASTLMLWCGVRIGL